MRGRKPKPAALKLVAGNPGKRKPRHREPKAKHCIPSPPAHLSPEALVAWGALSTRLDRLGLLTELDAFALEQLCENYAEILELRVDVRVNGRFQSVMTKSGDEMERLRPAASLLADAERRFRGMMSEFGLTPSARTRVDTKHDDDQAKADPADAYFA